MKARKRFLDFLIPLAATSRHNNIKIYNAVSLQEINVFLATLYN